MASLTGLFGQAVRDAQAVGRAELALLKGKALERLRRSRTGIVLLLLAAVIALAGLFALATGFVLALLPLVGAAGAGAIVFAGALAIAALLGFFGAKQFSAPATPPETRA